MKSNLLISFSKYLKSEGIYYTQCNNIPVIIACISGKFVAFDLDNALSEVAKKRILRKGGEIFYPSSLEDLVKVVRNLEV